MDVVRWNWCMCLFHLLSSQVPSDHQGGSWSLGVWGRVQPTTQMGCLNRLILFCKPDQEFQGPWTTEKCETWWYPLQLAFGTPGLGIAVLLEKQAQKFGDESGAIEVQQLRTACLQCTVCIGAQLGCLSSMTGHNMSWNADVLFYGAQQSCWQEAISPSLIIDNQSSLPKNVTSRSDCVCGQNYSNLSVRYLHSVVTAGAGHQNSKDENILVMKQQHMQDQHAPDGNMLKLSLNVFTWAQSSYDAKQQKGLLCPEFPPRGAKKGMARRKDYESRF